MNNKDYIISGLIILFVASVAMGIIEMENTPVVLVGTPSVIATTTVEQFATSTCPNPKCKG